MAGNLVVDVIKDFGIFEESANRYGQLAEVAFGGNTTKTYLTVRRWANQTDGTTRIDKGYTFSTPEGPAELAKCIINGGFGTTKEYLDTLSNRDDFRKALNSVLNNEDDEFYDKESGTVDDDFYDPRTLFE